MPPRKGRRLGRKAIHDNDVEVEAREAKKVRERKVKKLGETEVETVGETDVEVEKVGETEVKKVGDREVGNVGETEVDVEVEVEKVGDTEVEVEKVGDTEVEVEKVGDTEVEVEKVGETEVEVENVGETEVEVKVGATEVEVEKVGETEVEVEVENVGETEVGMENVETEVEQVEEHDDDIGIIAPTPPRIVHHRAKAVPGTPKKKRKLNTIAFPFTPDQEKDLAEWYRENPRFYNKRCRDYRMTQVKQRMMEDKANEMKDPDGGECTAAQLAMWWHSMRTYYGKLTKEVQSWSGANRGSKLTDRELWIKLSFNFLSDHIIRIKGREGHKICLNILKTAAPTPSPASPASAELDTFARDIVSSMRRVPEERWNEVNMQIMIVIRNFSGAVSTDTGVGYWTPELAPCNPNYNYTESPSFNFNAPARLNRISHGPAVYRAPASTTSPSQFWHSFASQHRNMQTQRPGGQYMHLGTTSASITDTTSNSATTNVPKSPGVDEYFGF